MPRAICFSCFFVSGECRFRVRRCAEARRVRHERRVRRGEASSRDAAIMPHIVARRYGASSAFVVARQRNQLNAPRPPRLRVRQPTTAEKPRRFQSQKLAAGLSTAIENQPLNHGAPCRAAGRLGDPAGSAVRRLDFDCTSGDCFINRQNIFHQPMKIFLSTDEKAKLLGQNAPRLPVMRDSKACCQADGRSSTCQHSA